MPYIPNSDRNPFRSLFAFSWVWRTAIGALLAVLVVRAVVVQVFYVPSPSMAPTLRVSDRVLVDKLSPLWSQPGRGDVVVFDGADVWLPAGTDDAGPATRLARFAGLVPGADTLFVKRVIAVAGDTVACCTAAGALTVNGRPLSEPYATGSSQPFRVTVGEGRLWVMGDNRPQSTDSRHYLGQPGGGTIPAHSVRGRVVALVWPIGRAGILSAPQAKDTDDR